MEQIWKIEATLSGDLGELYAGLLEAFASSGSIPLAEVNRALIQTGLVHHLAMMQGVGLLGKERGARLQELADRLARDTIMWEVLLAARAYWARGAQGGPDAT